MRLLVNKKNKVIFRGLLIHHILAKASVRGMEAQRLNWNSLQRYQIVAFEISG